MIPNQTSVLCRIIGAQLTRLNTKCALQKHNAIFTRTLRGERRIFREKIPKYRVNLGKVPPLTKLLAKESPSQIKDRNKFHLTQLQREKLEVYKQYLPTNQKPVLLEALFNPTNDIHELLTIIDHNLSSMTSFYLGVCFEVLDDMIRHECCDPMTVAVSPELTRLCKRTIFKLRYFESDDLLKLVKCLSSLKIPEDTLITRATLQMTRHHINDFNLDELQMLSNCLEAIKPIDATNKSLLVAIQRAIPLAKQIQIESKLFTEPNQDSLPSERIESANPKVNRPKSE